MEDKRYVRRYVRKKCLTSKDMSERVSKKCQKECQDMSERMSEDMPERMSEDMSEEMSERMSKDMSERMSEDMSEDMSEKMSKEMSEDMPERMSKDMSQILSEDMPEDMSKDMSERMSEDMAEDMSERLSKDMSNNVRKNVRKNVRRYVRRYVGRNARRYVRKIVNRYVRKNVRKNVKRYVRKNVKRYVRKNFKRFAQRCVRKKVRRYVRKNVRRYVRKNVKRYVKKCQKEFLKICQKECQKICQKECQKICQKERRVVRKNVRNMSDRMSENVCYGSQGKCLWVMLHKTHNFAIGNAAKLMLCHLMWPTAANTCGSTVRAQASEVGLAAMSELVVEGPATIFIGASSRLQRESGMCGAMSWSLTWAHLRFAWSRLALRMLGIVCSLCHRLWRELCGMCVRRESCSKWGGRARVGAACSSLSNFGVLLRLECMSGKPMLCRAGPATPKRCKRYSGKHLTSWFAHTMRCSCGCVLTCMASWDSTASLAGLSDARGVCVCVCVLLQALCIFGLNCFLAGRSDAIECNCRMAIWQTQSCHGYHFCCVVWGKFRVCGAAFVWSCGCYVLSLICQKECQKICQKACQKICQKECQKICQKECQKICQKEFQKICQKECQKIRQKECQKICCFALCLNDSGWIGRAKVVV